MRESKIICVRGKALFKLPKTIAKIECLYYNNVGSLAKNKYIINFIFIF